MNRRHAARVLAEARSALAAAIRGLEMLRGLEPGDLDDRGRAIAVELCGLIEELASMIRQRLTGGPQ